MYFSLCYFPTRKLITRLGFDCRCQQNFSTCNKTLLYRGYIFLAQYWIKTGHDSNLGFAQNDAVDERGGRVQALFCFRHAGKKRSQRGIREQTAVREVLKMQRVRLSTLLRHKWNHIKVWYNFGSQALFLCCVIASTLALFCHFGWNFWASA